jgi:hypothetical protein
MQLYSWDKQEHELDYEYEAFKLWLDKSDSLSNKQILNIYNKKFPEAALTLNQFLAVQKQNEWVERKQQWTHHVVTVSNLKSEKEELGALIEYQRKQKQLANTLTDIAQSLLVKATEALELLDSTALNATNLVKFVQAAAEIAQIGLSAEASALMITDLVAILDRSTDDNKIVVRTSQSVKPGTDLDIFREAVDDYERLAAQNQLLDATGFDEEGYT